MLIEATALIIVSVIGAILYSVRYIKRRKQKKKVVNPTKTVKSKTLHRCPNTKCRALFEHPHKETVYITTPPSVKLKCPECGETLSID